MSEEERLKYERLHREMNRRLAEFCILKSKASQERYWLAEDDFFSFIRAMIEKYNTVSERQQHE